MKTVDLYSKFKDAIRTKDQGYELFQDDPSLQFLESLARSWEMDLKSARRWLNSVQARDQEESAKKYLSITQETIRKVESTFGRELPGVLVLMPSFGEFDGFARYDSGSHTVLFGIDLPGSDVDYLKALTAHELSHVFRDHSPEVWGHLGKPLKEVSRKEYLDAATAEEHLVSEGIATLFSQVLFPEIDRRIHHYYDEREWEWCLQNHDRIHESFMECLRGDRDVWSYYSPSRVAPGSPSRTQYYWASHILSNRIRHSKEPLLDLVNLHQHSAEHFTEFDPKS